MMLGDLIDALRKEEPNRVLPIGFSHPHSYRGFYDQLAFEPCRDVLLKNVLAEAEGALNKVYQGWKGGDYRMGQHTDVWLAYEGTTQPGEPLSVLTLGMMLGWTPEQVWEHLREQYS